MELPDCPHFGCDARKSLDVVTIEPHGVLLCVCWCCAKECRVQGGIVIWPKVGAA